jgi:hypothetical protein
VTFGRRRVFVYGGITHCAGPSQVLRLTTTLSYSLLVRQNQPNGPTTPDTQRLPAITRMWFGLFRFRSPLLTESRLLSLPVGTEMFHFPTFPPHALCVQAWVTGHDSCRVSPFGNPRITARSAAPRGLSQPPTSFFGSWCQGIHRAPLLTWPQRCSRPLCSSQGTGDNIDALPRTPSGAVRSSMCQTCALACGPARLSRARNRIDMPMRLRANSAPSGLNSVPTPQLAPRRFPCRKRPYFPRRRPHRTN